MENKPIRVLHILQRMEAGGTQALLMNLYRNIDRTKVQFDFLVEYPEKYFYDDEIIELGGKVYYGTVRKDYNIFKFIKYLKQIIKENNYQIVHVHAFTIGFFCLKAAKSCGVPVRIAHSHSNEIVHDKKYIIKKVLQKLYTIYATDLFACSEEAGKYLFKSKKFKVLNNAIDSKKFIFDENKRKKARKEIGTEDYFVIGNVGRFQPEKNQLFLLDIFACIKKEIPKSKLLLVGTGPLEEELRKKAINMNLMDDVIILSNRKDMPEIFQSMDVFVLPSLYEGLGIVAVEAQASGIPVLSSDMLPEVSNVTPIITKMSLEKDATEWAKKAIEITQNKLVYTNMNDYIVKAGFDIEENVKSVEKFYLEKIGE